MGIRSWVGRMLLASMESAVMERRAVSVNDDHLFTIHRGSAPTLFQRSGREARLRGWEQNAVVNACVRVIVDILAAVDFEVYRLKADGTAEVVPNHDAALLLNVQPRADISGNRLRARLGTHYLLYGNGMFEIERSGRKRIVGLNPIHPENIKYVYVNDLDQAVRYDWQTIQGKAMESPVEDIVHFRDLTADPDALFGFPRAAAALADMVTDAEATQYVRQVVTNYGAPGLAVLTEGIPSLADLTAAEEKWHQKFVEFGQRGRTKFVAGVKDIKQIGFSLAELEFPDLRSITREDICAAIGPDPRIIGIQSAASDGGLSGEQYREARFRLIQQSVMPIMKNWEAELNRWLMPEFGDYYVRFNPDTLSEMTEDESATSTRGLAELAAGAIAVEEYRDLTGRSAELDPTHHIVQSGQIVQVGVVLAEAAKTPQEKAAAIADTIKPTDEDEADETEPGSTDEGTSTRSSSADASAVASVQAPHVLARALTPEQRLARWERFDTRATREESAYAIAARILFEVERQDVGRLLADDPVVDAIIAQLAGSYSPEGDYFRAWVQRYESLIAGTMREAGADLLKPVGLDFDLANPRVSDLIRVRVNKLAGNVTDTTYQQILGLIDVGRAAGMGTREIASLINEGVFGGAAEQRSLTIARTETVGALNAGEHAAAIESGVFQSKEWLSQGDGRVRESHAAIDGQRVPIGGLFSNGLQYPGDQTGAADEVVNCRCTVLYHDMEA